MLMYYKYSISFSCLPPDALGFTITNVSGFVPKKNDQ